MVFLGGFWCPIHVVRYANFDNLAYWQEQYNLLIALTLFLSWIKIFKYLSFNRTMTQMSQTLAQCANDILGYTVMFFIVFFSYAQLGYLVFGSNTFGYGNFDTLLGPVPTVFTGCLPPPQPPSTRRVTCPTWCPWQPPLATTLSNHPYQPPLSTTPARAA